MSKLKNLQQVLTDVAKPKPIPQVARSETTLAESAPPPTSRPVGKPLNRVGKRHIGAWLDMDFGKSLRLAQIRAGMGVCLADLMAEALNDLFRKYDVPTVSNE